MKGQTDKINYTEDVKMIMRNDSQKSRNFYEILIKNILCMTDKVNYTLDAHYYREPLKKSDGTQ